MNCFDMDFLASVPLFVAVESSRESSVPSCPVPRSGVNRRGSKRTVCAVKSGPRSSSRSFLGCVWLAALQGPGLHSFAPRRFHFELLLSTGKFLVEKIRVLASRRPPLYPHFPPHLELSCMLTYSCTAALPGLAYIVGLALEVFKVLILYC